MLTYLDKNNKKIIIYENTLVHLRQHLDVLEHLEKTISLISLNGKIYKDIIFFDTNIGFTGSSKTKETNMEDKIFVAKRNHRKIYSRVVIVEPEPCSSIVIIARSTKNNEYALITAYIGTLSEKEINDKNLRPHERETSINFWKNNALIYDEKLFGTIKETTFENLLNNKIT